MFCQSIVTFREDVLLPQLPYSAASDLDVPAKRFGVPRAVVLDHDTSLHPFINLFPPEVDLSFYTRCQLCFKRREFIGEACMWESELRVESGQELCLLLKMRV